MNLSYSLNSYSFFLQLSPAFQSISQMVNYLVPCYPKLNTFPMQKHQWDCSPCCLVPGGSRPLPCFPKGYLLPFFCTPLKPHILVLIPLLVSEKC